MLRVRALGPCSLSGFRTLLRGDVCDVPDERREQAERLRNVGRLEFVEVVPVAAEPSGNEAPADAIAETTGSSAPAALSPEEQAEVDRLQAELAELEQKKADEPPAPTGPQKPKRPPFVCVCGKLAEEHKAGKTKLDDSFCGGLKKFMKRADTPAVP
jgi:hypothetical protein